MLVSGIAQSGQNLALSRLAIMPTVVGILTFISRTNTASARNVLIFQNLSYEKLKYHAQLSMKSYNLEA